MPPKAAKQKGKLVLRFEEDMIEQQKQQQQQQKLRKPGLPVLRGVPSARRAYSYGAAEEPPPPRPGYRGGKDGEPVNLHSIVRAARTRAAQNAEQEEREINMRFPIEARAQAVQDAAREQRERETGANRAGDLRKAAMRNALPPPPAPARESSPEMSDNDDARSFGMESDVFGDATIASTPGGPSEYEPLTQSSASALRQRPVRFPIPPRPATSSPAAAQNGEPRGTAKRTVPRRREESYRQNDESYDDDSEMEDEVDDESLPSAVVAAQPRRRNVPRLDEDSRPSPFGFGADSERQAQISNFFTAGTSNRQPLSASSGNGAPAARSSNWFSSPVSSPQGGIFGKVRDLAASVSPFLASAHHLRSDHSEMDDALQQELQRVDDEESGSASGSEPATPQAEQRRSWWQTAFASHVDEDETKEQESELELHLEQAASEFSFLQLLNPYTYFQALMWLLGNMLTAVKDSFNMIFTRGVVDMLRAGLRTLLYSLTFFIALYTIVGLIGPTPETYRWVDIPAVSMQDANNIITKLRELVPWPSRGLPHRWSLDDADTSDVFDYMQRYEQDSDRLKEAAKAHEASLQKLEAILPKIIHVDRKDGKPVVSDEFWHALRELLRADDTFFTLNKKGNTYEVRSEKQLRAIAARLAEEPAFTDVVVGNVKDAEDRLAKSMPAYWETWVKTNEGKITRLLGAALDKIQAGGSQKDFDKRLEDLVKDNIEKGNKNVVTKEDFLSHLRNELAAHRAEVRAELESARPQIDDIVKKAAELAVSQVPKGMARGEVTTLIHTMVQKALGDLNLDKLAQGKIQNHWDKILKHQVNYFSPGQGASIDGYNTSPTFRPSERRPTQEEIDQGLAHYGYSVPIRALQPWTEDGDRWCGSRSINRRGNPHGVILSVQMGQRITPQHIVIEHILPEATIDSGARPRDIEIYADIEPNLRERVRSFSTFQFPDNEEDWNFTPADLPERFIKIGQFVYEENQPHDGVQVHRLSDELADMGVDTDHVIVRAVSNYGAKDYTCFYRVRLFGKRKD